MLFVEGDLNIGLWASIQDDDWLALVICLFPCINIMEDVVRWELKPLDLVYILAMLLHDSIFSRLVLVKLEDKASFFHCLIWLELQGKIWHNDVIVCNREVVDHPHASDLDIHLVEQSSILIKQGIMDVWLLHIVAKAIEFSSFGIDLWMG